MSDADHTRGAPYLVLALGNDLLGDDKVGLLAARVLGEKFNGHVDIEESAEAGIVLLEKIDGYERVLLLDAIVSGQQPPGTIIEYNPEDLSPTSAPSPHWIGIPELITMSKHLQIGVVNELRILALEVENPFDFRDDLTPEVERALPEYIECASHILESWCARPATE